MKTVVTVFFPSNFLHACKGSQWFLTLSSYSFTVFALTFTYYISLSLPHYAIKKVKTRTSIFLFLREAVAVVADENVCLQVSLL
jgi:hypothetical protein